jgi:hypothetical protein
MGEGKNEGREDKERQRTEPSKGRRREKRGESKQWREER